MIVVGAGMAGLLAAAMLRDECAGVIEKQPSLPNNHSAVLRFRTMRVADVLNVPFKQVQAVKSIVPWSGNAVADMLAYSNKCTGKATLRSITTATDEPVTRYIAPADLIQRMARMVVNGITFGKDAAGLIKGSKEQTPIISTLPMPLLMEGLGYRERHNIIFESQPGMNINATLLGVDAYCSLYVPNPALDFSRISITGDRLTIEFPRVVPPALQEDDDTPRSFINLALGYLGIGSVGYRDVDVREQKYAKILPIDESQRKRFIIWASEEFNIYSLGRFATWRPGLLLDDVVHDVRVIHRLVNGGSSYDHRK